MIGLYNRGRHRMCVEERILTCRLLEKMWIYKEYGKKLGLQDVSRMHGIQIKKGNEKFLEKG